MPGMLDVPGNPLLQRRTRRHPVPPVPGSIDAHDNEGPAGINIRPASGCVRQSGNYAPNIEATFAGAKNSAGEIVPAFICTNRFIASWFP
jgi:hypothetical protein